jgi:hypothetical protein
MSTHTKAQRKAQFRHPGSRGKGHKRDKAQGEARQETAWLGVDAPLRAFPGMDGHEYRHDGKAWHRCPGPEEFGDYLEAEAKRRGHYMSRTTRKGVEVDMKRPVKTPLEVQTTTLAPWVSDWLAVELAEERAPPAQADRNPQPVARRRPAGPRRACARRWRRPNATQTPDYTRSSRAWRGGRTRRGGSPSSIFLQHI